MYTMFLGKFDLLWFTAKYVTLKWWPIASGNPNIQTSEATLGYRKSLFYHQPIVEAVRSLNFLMHLIELTGLLQP